MILKRRLSLLLVVVKHPDSVCWVQQQHVNRTVLRNMQTIQPLFEEDLRQLRSFIWRGNHRYCWAVHCWFSGWIYHKGPAMDVTHPLSGRDESFPCQILSQRSIKRLSSWTQHLPTWLERCPGLEVHRASVTPVNGGACADPGGYYKTTPSFSYNLFTLLPSGEHADLTSVEPPDCRAAVFLRLQIFSLHPLAYLCPVSDLAIF